MLLMHLLCEKQALLRQKKHRAAGLAHCTMPRRHSFRKLFFRKCAMKRTVGLRVHNSGIETSQIAIQWTNKTTSSRELLKSCRQCKKTLLNQKKEKTKEMHNIRSQYPEHCTKAEMEFFSQESLQNTLLLLYRLPAVRWTARHYNRHYNYQRLSKEAFHQAWHSQKSQDFGLISDRLWHFSVKRKTSSPSHSQANRAAIILSNLQKLLTILFQCKEMPQRYYI